MRHRDFARLAIAVSILAVGASAVEAGGRHRAARMSKPMAERECLARAMYFESARTEDDGMLAVGTVVANRLASGRYGETVCKVVGQRAQFAPGVLTRSMRELKVAARAREVADAVLAGERHPVAGDAMFFHTANVPFRHDDKAYLLVSGGNAFYRWNRGDAEAERANVLSLAKAVARADHDEAIGEQVLAEVSKKRVPEAGVTVAAAPADLPPAADQPPAAPPAADPLPAVAAASFRRDALGAGALAYREEAPRTLAADQALATLATLKLRPGPRVIAPAAPVQAAMGPVFPAAATKPAPEPKPADAPGPGLLERANAAIAEAWSAFR